MIVASITFEYKREDKESKKKYKNVKRDPALLYSENNKKDTDFKEIE